MAEGLWWRITMWTTKAKFILKEKKGELSSRK